MRGNRPLQDRGNAWDSPGYAEHHLGNLSEAVLERRSEIGVRRALRCLQGAHPDPVPDRGDRAVPARRRDRGHRRRRATALYAHEEGWPAVIPAQAWAGGIAAALLIGALAGLLPAIRAARLSPTQALWSL
jgi:putative ABC transport system permease protein